MFTKTYPFNFLLKGDKMDKLGILKTGVELLTSIGVGSIVGNAIKLTTDPNSGRLKKIAIGFGGFVLSSMTSELATTYTNKKIDDTAEKLSGLFNTRAVVEISKDGVDVEIKEETPEISLPVKIEDGKAKTIKKDEDE